MSKSSEHNELLSLKNVGQATLRDFDLLGINSIKQLASFSPDELFIRLQKLTGQKQDPCVWDIFASSINEARTGEKTPWWEWSKIRKIKQENDDFCV